ncbi:MAG: C39 family peptidase [Candidatus Yanofskybacteria bacterium]|nr:C39 family peptidase [Candidatus Yanofskybacteria bacterium]
MKFIIPIIIITAIAAGWKADLFRTPEPSASVSPTKTAQIKSPTPTPRTTAATLPAQVLLNVPFMAQSPLGNWSDPRQQDACEEASLLMAYHWATGEPIGSLQESEAEIIAFAEYQIERYGHAIDTSAADTVKLMKEYLEYSKVRLVYDITLADIKTELAKGNLVIVPALGRELPNPNFTPPGPLRHMFVIIGYDDSRQQFITNDPGTRQGKGFRYAYSVMEDAFFDYPTGRHEPLTEMRRAMIVVEK